MSERIVGAVDENRELLERVASSDLRISRHAERLLDEAEAKA